MTEVLYSDNHLLCLDKPGGLLTQPSGTERESLEQRGKEWIRQQTGKSGNIFLEAVHRIDAVACGVVLFARTSKALSRLNEAIRAGHCQKEYRVLVEGCPAQRRGHLCNYLLHDEHLARIVPRGVAGAMEATLDYEVLESSDNMTLLKVLLGTGRYHQIRVQLAHLGYPIVGDLKYGARHHYKGNGAIALQHYCLTIQHPVGGRELKFCSRLRLLKNVSD